LAAEAAVWSSAIVEVEPRARLQSAQDQTPAHPALSAAHQREGGALHPHPARRLGLRRDLPDAEGGEVGDRAA